MKRALVALGLVLNKGHIGSKGLVYTEPVPPRALTIEKEKEFISSTDREVLEIKVYQDGTVNINKGSLNIGNGNFIVDNAGNVTIGSGGNIIINSGSIGGMTINNSSLVFTTTKTESNKQNTYRTAVYARAGTDELVFEAGLVQQDNTTMNAPFRVTGKGALYANSGTIGGWKITDNILYKDLSQTERVGLYASAASGVKNPVFYIGNKDKTTNNDKNTKFKISSDGSVFFKGGIYGWSSTKNAFKKGYESGQINFYTTDKQSIAVEICQGLIVDIR